MANDKLLQEIRENYDYDSSQWKEIREEGDIDMRLVAGDPWDAKERRARESAKRMILSLDEVTQYCNQLINDVRQNKRAIKVVPKGAGANDFTAEKRGDQIREIEYKSKAQAAYRTAFENVVQRSYGAWKYNTQYISDSAFEQELVVERIPNPNVVLMDWDAREADFSDADHIFELDTISTRSFQKRFPDAKIKDFSGDMIAEYPAWIKTEKRIQIASYWKVRRKKHELLQLANGKAVFLDDALRDMPGAEIQYEEAPKENPRQKPARFIVLPGGFRYKVVQSRQSEQRTVCQYVTNGIEILEENEWGGKNIPIVYITGKEIWVDEGGGAKRKLLSLVRLARDPVLLYCYIRTTEAELIQQIPKAPYIGYEGQFATTTDWANIHKLTTAYAEVKGETEQSMAHPARPWLPIPQRNLAEVAIQALEMSAESARRAIQSAMGITGLLNGANDTAEARSGVALKTMDQQESQGNFHFIDNLDLGLEYGGRMLGELLPTVYDSPRQAGFRKPSGEHYSEHINRLDEQGNKVGYHTDVGEHDYQITTGPSYDSQRQEAQEFAENIATQIPGVWEKIGDLIIKLRNLGPIGDEMAKRLAPPDPNQVSPAQAQQLMAQLQMAQQVIAKLVAERRGKVIEAQAKVQVASMQQQVDLQEARMRMIGQIGAALAKAGSDQNISAFEAEMERIMFAWDKMHELYQMQNQQPAAQPGAQPQQPPAAGAPA